MDIDLSALRAIEREYEIPLAEIMAIIEVSVLAAYHRHVGNHDKARAQIDQKTGHVAIFTSVEDEEGNEVGETEVTPEDFGRIAAYAAKQVISQKLRDLKDESLLGEFKGKQGDIVTGVIQQGPRPHMVYISLGTVEAVMPAEEQVATESYEHGKRIRVFVTRVNKGTRGGPEVTVSRTHKGLIRKLFELEVPEVASGAVEIVQIARDPGHRTKIAVRAKQEGINAKGSCIGELGQRVRAVSAELNEEKIDIVDYSDNLPEFVAHALSPAKVASAYMIDEKQRAVRVLVPDYQLSLAIGKEGQNARLAASLTGAKIDIQPESILEED